MARKKNPSRDLKSFSSLASFRLHKLSRLSDRLHERRYQTKFGLSLREYRIIGLTGALGNASFRRICEESNLDKAHVSRLIDRLVGRDLLTKAADPADQRSITVRLTDRGLTVHRSLFEESSQLNEQWLSVLSTAQQEAFLSALDILHARARQMVDERRHHDPAVSVRIKAHAKKTSRAASPAAKGDVVLDHETAHQLLQVLSAALGK